VAISMYQSIAFFNSSNCVGLATRFANPAFIICAMLASLPYCRGIEIS
jgi:hypothetical protein